LAAAEKGVYFVGRLATYQYYNMDQVVGQALSTFKRIQAQHQSADLAMMAGQSASSALQPSDLRV
jgi:hypothetical protein